MRWGWWLLAFLLMPFAWLLSDELSERLLKHVVVKGPDGPR